MHHQQNAVADFHRALDIPIADTPGLRRVELRCALLAEECKEAIEAAELGELAHAAKELCDILYVVYGAALEWGIDLGPFWDAVHESNMAKTGGPTRHDGKRLKPEGWQPPDVQSILMRQVAEAKPVGDPQPEGNYRSIIGRSATAALGG